MSEQRFYLGNNSTTICDRSQGGSDGFNMLTIFKVVDLLNEQQDEINSLKRELELITGAKLFSRRELERTVKEQQATIRKLQDLCGESDSENAKLRIENKKLKAKLREKEEDERLYANEILELRETNKEHIKFKSLGGNY